MSNREIIADDTELASLLADVAGKLLIAVRDSYLIDGKALGISGDACANAFLMAALCHQRPDDGILSEETECDGTRLDKRRVWIIDPVDGTRE